MVSVNHLKKEHEELFREILELEDIINKKKEVLNHLEIMYIFQRITGLLYQHENKKKDYLNELNGNPSFEVILKKISIDPRRINGHIYVINEAILSKNPESIKVALDNDGRMLISRIKEHIFKEEMVLDRLLFLHMIH